MSQQEATQRLEDGVSYSAILTLTVVGGRDTLEIKLEKTPKEYLEGEPTDVIEMPISYLMMDDIVEALLQETKPESKKPNLRVVH